MSSSSFHRKFPNEKFNDSIFIAVAWACFALSFLFFIARIGVRAKVFRHVYADDGLVFLALLISLINTARLQTTIGILDETYAVLTGQVSPTPDNFPKRTESCLRQTIATILLFYSGLWAVKLSFLLFFKRLGHNVRHQKTIWWTVAAMTGATYLACLGMVDYRCLAGSYQYIQTVCSTPERVAFQTNATLYSMIMDVVSDALIIFVPVNMLWKVQISHRQKFALAGVFFITVFVMVFAIIRGVLKSPFNPQSDATWLFMWSLVELNISIIVACIASFRALLVDSKRQSRQNIEDGISRTNQSSSFRMVRLYNRIVKKTPKTSTEEAANGWTHPRVPPVVTTISASRRSSRFSMGSRSQGPVFPRDSVHVQTDITVVSS